MSANESEGMNAGSKNAGPMADNWDSGAVLGVRQA